MYGATHAAGKTDRVLSFSLSLCRYHKVSQSCDEGEIVVAVNYWYVWGDGADWIIIGVIGASGLLTMARYDMDFEGGLYPLCSMVRDMTMAMG